jgi:hypothetical protein
MSVAIVVTKEDEVPQPESESVGSQLQRLLCQAKPNIQEIKDICTQYLDECRGYRTADHANYLHIACFNECVLAEVELLQMLTDLFPEAIRLKNRFGQLPLHKAVLAAKDHCHISGLQLLLDLYPEGVRVKTIDGMTPLHLAVMTKNPCLEIIQTLILKCPDVAQIADAYGQYPLHKATGRSRMPIEIVKVLHEACPKVIELKDDKG